MYLVMLITVSVLMLLRPKTSVKKPSTWRHTPPGHVTGSHLCLPATGAQTDLTRPDGGDDEAAVLEHVEDLDDASRVTEDGDAGVRHGQVKGQEVRWLQGRALAQQHEEDHRVPEPGQPACPRTGEGHAQVDTQVCTHR